MLNLKWIRDYPDAFDRAMKRRNVTEQAASLLNLDQQHRACLQTLQDLQSERNAIAKKMGDLRRTGGDDHALKEQALVIKERIPSIEQQEQELKNQIQRVLERFPNILADDVPDGKGEEDNQVVKTWGTPCAFDFAPQSHDVLGEALGMMDFTTAAHLSGARFTLLKGGLARLERALAQFMLDMHTIDHGYLEVQPPYLVKPTTAYATGHLPKFEEDLFKTTSDHYLIPTAEMPLTAMVGEQILDAGALPLRLTAYTPCFRSEAGAAGRDTRGMIRNHQFHKVELVSITTPEQSEAEHQRMIACACTILEKLNLPYRMVLLCSADTGSFAAKTYDLEVWLPSQNTYREISSCSNCGDYQARRMNARFRSEQGITFVHTLNGSALAVGRTLVAILENYQRADGSIEIPEVLRPYMNHLKEINSL